jgi:CelD/BcsL family acetyltransferase involved in cellulose biosynthesis
VEIHVAHGKAPAEWDDLVRRDEAATFFHTSTWNALLEETGAGFHPVWLLLDAGGTLAAGLPAAIRERSGVRVLSSMPHGTFGGPVVSPGAPDGAAASLLDTFRKTAREARTGAAHLVDFAGRVGDRLEGFETAEGTAQVLALDRDYEELWSGFKPSARNKIRKAQKAGVTVRRADSEADFLTYCDMLAECERKWGAVSEFSEEFFRALSGVDRGLVHVWLAEHEGEIIAGDLNFVTNGTVFNWGNVSRESAKRLAPNNLLHAAAIEDGLREGHSVYNLGSSAGIPGVEAFKESFGTTRVAYREYRSEKPWYRAARALATGRRGGRS